MSTPTFRRYNKVKPETFQVTHLVEVQIGFAAIRLARHEYIFLPKLRAICLLNRAVEQASILLWTICISDVC